MGFIQAPPQLGNQYSDDRVLRGYLARVLPPEVLRDIEGELQELGELAGGELFALQRADRLNEPTLTAWDPWGNRIDAIEVTPLWKRAEALTVKYGLVSTPYERRHGALSRVDQFARVHLFNPSTDVYTCPLAMTDGAARTLLAHGNQALIDRALPRLTSRDLASFWTSGQWMTERTGGSDVGISETVARQADGRWTLHGVKWFTSATTAQMALTLARPEGGAPKGRGLALFYVETRDDAGRLQGITVHRLKDKMGTRKVPTAELTLDGLVAVPVAGLTDGVRNISPMLNITRTWNAVSAVSFMRRAMALSRDYARRRVAFGAPLAEKPLHVDTLAGMQAESEAAFHLAFYAVELIGREESGEADARDKELLRLVTPLAKLTTGKQGVGVSSELLECFGGAGYVEDTGIPALHRDAQVLPIWEGTTNVLSLDVMKVLGKGALALLAEEIRALVGAVREPALGRAASRAIEAVAHADAVAQAHMGRALEGGSLLPLEADARRIALTLGRALALALLARHAQWSLDRGDARPAAAAKRFARHGVDLLDDDASLEESALLSDDR
ncbi:MAG: acyl-CoA dehydrogenase family protein [Polyangiales bacterium]